MESSESGSETTVSSGDVSRGAVSGIGASGARVSATSVSGRLSSSLASPANLVFPQPQVTSEETIDDNVYVSKGQIQLIDHGTGQVFHAKVRGTYVYGDTGDTSIFMGVTKDGLNVAVAVVDKDMDGAIKDGDLISIEIQDEFSNTVYSNEGVLRGGNISVK